MIAVVVPTIRGDRMSTFKEAWKPLFEKHNVTLLTVWDGDMPVLEVGADKISLKEIMGKDADLVTNKNDGVRNLGFAYTAKYLFADYVITLDDDVLPVEDTIQDHIDALNLRVPVTWSPTATEYTRGFPYKVRDEAEVVLSHGVWQGVKDWDAPTQLVSGNKDVSFAVGPIPKGILYPMCGMNIAFKRKLLPYMYFAPMGPRVGVDRFADIWCGIESKKVIDSKGWAVVTGYSSVWHDRASNVFTNLKKEAVGLEMNENYGEDPYFRDYAEKRARWEKLCQHLV